MSSMMTIRGIDPKDKSWLQREARRLGVSMEELVRRIIHEKRERALRRERPSEAFRRHFGPEHGVELPERSRYGYRPVQFEDDRAE